MGSARVGSVAGCGDAGCSGRDAVAVAGDRVVGVAGRRLVGVGDGEGRARPAIVVVAAYRYPVGVVVGLCYQHLFSQRLFVPLLAVGLVAKVRRQIGRGFPSDFGNAWVTAVPRRCRAVVKRLRVAC